MSTAALMADGHSAVLSGEYGHYTMSTAMFMAEEQLPASCKGWQDSAMGTAVLMVRRPSGCSMHGMWMNMP